MINRVSSYIWFILILLSLFLWLNRDTLFRIFQARPSPDSLEFNSPKGLSESGPIVVSNDEKINIEVFDKVHPAVVNIVATTLGVNFWMDIIPREGQGSGFIIDKGGYILTNNHVVAKAQRIIPDFATIDEKIH